MKLRRNTARILIILMVLSVPCFSYAAGAESSDIPEYVYYAEPEMEEPDTADGTIPDAEPEEETSTELTDEVTEVIVADSVEELAASSVAADNEPYFSIDVKKKTVSGDLATEEISEEVKSILSGDESTSEKKEAVVTSLAESGYYSASEGSGSSVEVTSVFAFQRLRLVAPRSAELRAYGAETAVFYDDHYLLSYESEEATRLAFDALTADYGEDSVFIDLPVRACGSAKGWGTSFMKLDSEMTRPEAKNKKVTIAVVDSGIIGAHPVFDGRRNNILYGYDFANNDTNPSDDNGHGTAVAGIIAESTPSNYTIMAVKALDSNGVGSAENIMNALEYAEYWGADIINMSLVCELNEYGSYERSYAAYWDQKIRNYNAIVVCAAGNGDVYGNAYDLDSPGMLAFPAELSSTICVGSLNYVNGNTYWSSFSNYGNAVDFAAPGENIYAADWKSGGFSSGDGTSLASPYIASAAAILRAELGVRGVDNMRGVLGFYSYDIGPSGRDAYFGTGCPVFTGDRRIKGITPTVKLSQTSFTYTGKSFKPSVIVKDGNTTLKKGTDYQVKYYNNVGAGTGYALISCMNTYYGFATATFTIHKAGNVLDAAGRTASVRKSKLKKKAQTVSPAKMFNIRSAIGPLHFAKLGGSKKLSISSTGKVKVKKKTKKGKYKMTVRVTAKGDGNHNAAYQDVLVTVRVK